MYPHLPITAVPLICFTESSRCIMLELKEGEGTVAGFNLRGLDWKKVPYLRRNLGVVFQDFQLLTDRNVNDNMKFRSESYRLDR